jgi:flagellar biosynthesis/type III secretory pathway M-ring protein FliF/YscJ
MDSVKSALESIARMWAALKATQKVILSASAAAMVLLLVWGSAGTMPAMVRVAGPELDANKRQTILAKFQERNQKHEVRGAEIFVPKEDADRIVLELAGEGTLSDSGVWKFLEQSDIFATRWDKEKRYQIALQSRLESMIRSLESVKNASVVINPGSTSSQLGFIGPKASASVQVELKDGAELKRPNVRAIAGLVARAVSGVEEDQVHIMDTKGKSYRTSSVVEASELEHDREEKIQRELKNAFAFSGAVVIVRVQTKTSSSKVNKVEHSRPIPIEFEDNKKVRKGFAPQAPPRIRKGEGEGESLVEPPSRDEETETQSREKRVVDQKQTTEDNPAGEVLRITVGILIPVEVGPENKEMVEAEKLLPKLKEFALMAAGPPTRSEDVSVQLIPTKRPEAFVPAPPPDRAFEWVSAHGSKFALFGLALAGLFVMLRIAQVAMARDTVEELQSLTTALNETGEGAAAAGGLPAETELGRLKQNMQDMVGRNPQSVATSLKSFMSGR